MSNEVIKSFKGFDKDLKCRGFQYEIGKEYEESTAEACKCGFHACEHPLDVFSHYAPSDSRYCEVEQSGEIDKSESDKTCSTKIKIGAELSLKDIVAAAIKFTFEKSTPENTKHATGYRGASSATGDYGASSATGLNSIALAAGYQCKAKGAIGCWLCIAEREKWNGETYPIKEVRAVKVDGKIVKADTWYRLVNGELKEVG